MIESELAFNQHGEPFALPDQAGGWRVRRLRGGRGAPELVYGQDGRPLTLDIEAGMDELREAVDTSGRYRLDAIDDNGKAIENVQPSYVHVTVAPRNSSMPEPAALPALNSTDHAIRELVRANVELVRATSELAKSVSTQQPDLMKAAAEILRAADGAGLPRREPTAEWYDDDEESDEPEAAPKPGFDFATLMMQLGPMISKLTGVDIAKAGVLSSGSGGPTGATRMNKQPRTNSPEASRALESAKEPADETETKPAFVAADPNAHLLAIQSHLNPDERAFIDGVIKKLSLADLVQWRDQLAQMPVDDAVALIRSEIQSQKEKVS